MVSDFVASGYVLTAKPVGRDLVVVEVRNTNTGEVFSLQWHFRANQAKVSNFDPRRAVIDPDLEDKIVKVMVEEGVMTPEEAYNYMIASGFIVKSWLIQALLVKSGFKVTKEGKVEKEEEEVVSETEGDNPHDA